MKQSTVQLHQLPTRLLIPRLSLAMEGGATKKSGGHWDLKRPTGTAQEKIVAYIEERDSNPAWAAAPAKRPHQAATAPRVYRPNVEKEWNWVRATSAHPAYSPHTCPALPPQYGVGRRLAPDPGPDFTRPEWPYLFRKHPSDGDITASEAPALKMARMTKWAEAKAAYVRPTSHDENAYLPLYRPFLQMDNRRREHDMPLLAPAETPAEKLKRCLSWVDESTLSLRARLYRRREQHEIDRDNAEEERRGRLCQMADTAHEE